MSSEEEEIDYMSEEFLSQCVGNNDVRPGLCLTHSSKRKYEIEKKIKQDNENYSKKKKTIEEIQSEVRDEGLKTKIDTSNRGFALMQKMGYKSGTSLGKKGSGIVEPIAVELKLDRVGLGWQQMIAEKKKQAEQRRKEKHLKKQEETDPLKYRARLSNLHSQKLIECDLKKSRKVCYDLDSQAGLAEAHEYWFWPTYTWWENEEEEEEDEEEEDEDEDDNKRYKYYQGATGTSESEETREKTKKERVAEQDDLEEIYEPCDQLKIITSYLHSTYLYCIWCCTKYQDEEDLRKNCPGSTRAEHDDY